MLESLLIYKYIPIVLHPGIMPVLGLEVPKVLLLKELVLFLYLSIILCIRSIIVLSCLFNVGTSKRVKMHGMAWHSVG